MLELVESGYHTPVLLHDSIEGLLISPERTYVDVTFGGGGHSRLILENLGSGRLFAFDQDEDSLENITEDSRLTFIRQNFRFMKNHLRLAGVREVDGILADLGVSSHQFDEASRGFSTRFDSDLDMRMDRDSDLTARQLIEEYSKDELIRVLRTGSDVKSPSRIADEIIAARSQGIASTAQLKKILERHAPYKKQAQFFAQIFQAIRIEVNQELDALKAFLDQSIELLKPGGRLVVISYHSIEDRMVKNYIKSGNAEGELEKDFYGNVIKPFNAINRKVIVPSDEEVQSNPRARSAKLRIAEKR